MRYTILIVEDDRQMAQTLAAQFAVLGHVSALCYGPRMALQQLDEVIPDVIFMDINMPGVDGLEILRFLRRDPITANVPVVIVSAEEQTITRQAALEAGADYYLVKPPMLEDLEQALQEVVKLDLPESPEQPSATPAQDSTNNQQQAAGRNPA